MRKPKAGEVWTWRHVRVCLLLETPTFPNGSSICMILNENARQTMIWDSLINQNWSCNGAQLSEFEFILLGLKQSFLGQSPS